MAAGRYGYAQRRVQIKFESLQLFGLIWFSRSGTLRSLFHAIRRPPHTSRAPGRGVARVALTPSPPDLDNSPASSACVPLLASNGWVGVSIPSRNDLADCGEIAGQGSVLDKGCAQDELCLDFSDDGSFPCHPAPGLDSCRDLVEIGHVGGIDGLDVVGLVVNMGHGFFSRYCAIMQRASSFVRCLPVACLAVAIQVWRSYGKQD